MRASRVEALTRKRKAFDLEPQAGSGAERCALKTRPFRLGGCVDLRAVGSFEVYFSKAVQLALAP